MFDDDWEASTFLFPRQGTGSATAGRPPITLLVVVVGDNIIFDPSKEELAVAESALAVSVAETRKSSNGDDGEGMAVDGAERELKLLSIRMIDPPSRLTPPGVPNTANVSTGSGADTPSKQPQPTQVQRNSDQREQGVWKAPLGGTKFAVLDGIIQAVLAKGGVAHEVLDGLEGVELS
jgi:exosome complex component RRP42